MNCFVFYLQCRRQNINTWLFLCMELKHDDYPIPLKLFSLTSTKDKSESKIVPIIYFLVGKFTIQTFLNNPLSAALNLSLFGCISCYTATQEGMTCLHNNLVQKFFLHQLSFCSFFTSLKVSLSLSLSTHTHLNSKTHTTRFKLFFQYLQRNFSKFGQNHLLLDSSIDQYLPLRDWKATFSTRILMLWFSLITCNNTTTLIILHTWKMWPNPINWSKNFFLLSIFAISSISKLRKHDDMNPWLKWCTNSKIKLVDSGIGNREENRIICCGNFWLTWKWNLMNN